jgi:hypothetical protein
VGVNIEHFEVDKPSTSIFGGTAMLVPDDRSVAAHEQSLFDLNAKYADVVSLEETLQYLRAVGHNAIA